MKSTSKVNIQPALKSGPETNEKTFQGKVAVKLLLALSVGLGVYTTLGWIARRKKAKETSKLEDYGTTSIGWI